MTAVQAVELKVEVIWGRAYAADLALTREAKAARGWSSAVITRGRNKRGWHIEFFRGFWGDVTQAAEPLPHNSWLRFLHKPGYLRCAWRLAEKLARTAAADSIRADIFVIEGQPNACLLNEISLSSGSLMGAHMHYMGKLWAEGHARRMYVSTQDTRPVYELGTAAPL